MANDTLLSQVQEVLNSELTITEIRKKLDEILPKSCTRTVTKEDGSSSECNASTGNPYRYRHCVEITGCDDGSDNMPNTCGQWRCYG